MLNQDDKLERFAEVINRNARAQCKKIEKKAEKLKKRQLGELERQSKQELDGRLQFEIDRISAETNGAISALRNDSKLKVAQRRDEISREVFQKAADRLAEFASSASYRGFLESSVRALADSIGKDVIVFAREADVDAVKQIAAAIPAVKEVRASDKIRLGGVMASSEDETVFADDTLEERLNAQKEWFMLSSGLSIDE